MPLAVTVQSSSRVADDARHAREAASPHCLVSGNSTPASPRFERGEVIHVPSGRRKGYGELKARAPIGRSVSGRLDMILRPLLLLVMLYEALMARRTCRPRGSIDRARFRRMLFASIERAPTLGGTLVRFGRSRGAADARRPPRRAGVGRHPARRRGGGRRQLVGASRTWAALHLPWTRGHSARRRSSFRSVFSPSAARCPVIVAGLGSMIVQIQIQLGDAFSNSRAGRSPWQHHWLPLSSVPGARAAGADERYRRRGQTGPRSGRRRRPTSARWRRSPELPASTRPRPPPTA